MLINAIYWTEKNPRLLNKQEICEYYQSYSPDKPGLRVIGDISCDLDGAIQATQRPTKPDNPVYVYDPESGELRQASIFVAVLGASSYTYAEATWTRDLYDWIGSHVRTFEFFGGCTAAVVPDNWRTAVSKACWYEPELNPTYRDLAEHYSTVILPARVKKPRDKAKVESGVLLVER